MIKHYLKIAFRNLWKNKGFSAINIFGLSIGLTSCLLMAVYIQDELSYDQFQEKGDRIVRVIMEYGSSGKVSKGNFTSTKVAPTFKQAFTEVEEGVRMAQSTPVVKFDDKLFTERKFLFADSTFLKLFSFPLVSGNAQYALSGPRKVILTRSMAEKYFGKTDPIGKTLVVGSNETGYEITGLMNDCPPNSQIKFDFLASFSSLGANQQETYWNANYTTYLLLRDKAAITTLQRKVPGFMKKEMAAQGEPGTFLTYELEPFKRVHLYSPYDSFELNTSINYIYIIAAIALLILIIGCFTYINLSTARSIERAREVGIRKVTGAYKQQLFGQFIGESFLVTTLSFLLSLVVGIVLLPFFNSLADKKFVSGELFSPFTLFFAFTVISTVSLLAGTYPAFILSSYQPVKVLKGAFKNSNQGLTLRKSLIVFQFIISAFLIISTVFIQQQLRYIQSKKLGYDRNHVIVLPADQKINESIDIIKTTLKSSAGVLNISRVADDITNIRGGYNMRSAEMPEKTQLMVTANPVDDEFVPSTSLQIIAGENFSRQDMNDVAATLSREQKRYHFIVNEAAAKALGYTTTEAIGKKMFLGGDRPGEIKAVVKDFHFKSLHNAIDPLVLFTDPWANKLLVKLPPGNTAATLAAIQSTWKKLVPHRPFEYQFLDEKYNKLYSSELRLGKVLNVFASIAILLAIIGLFGLSAYTAQQRTKEISIRKILGASVASLVKLLSKDFLGLVLLASLVSAPLAWYVVHLWLQDFVYRIDISWVIFAVACLGTLVIAFCTVSIQAIRASISSPVKSLRSE